jgi:hypothetical protein
MRRRGLGTGVHAFEIVILLTSGLVSAASACSLKRQASRPTIPMKKLTLVVDERELSTIRAALLLLQEHVDALPEDLAEMAAAHGAPMTVPEIERLSLRLHETAKPLRDYAERKLPQATRLVEVERFPSTVAPRGRM